MAFTVTNLISKSDHYTCADKASLGADCVIVAGLVSLVCLIVIGKIDVGIPGEMSIGNPYVLAMIGTLGAIFVADMIMMIKKCLCAREALRKEQEAKELTEKCGQLLHYLKDPTKAAEASKLIEENVTSGCDSLLDKEGNTALHLGLTNFNNCPNIFILSQRRRFDVNAENNFGQRPLHMAVNSRSIQCVRWLNGHVISKSANLIVDAPDKEGNTPLHYACKGLSQNPETLSIVHFLVSRLKADPQISNNNKQTPLDLVPADRKGEIETLFRDKPPISGFGTLHASYKPNV